ncbi:haloacid dehalogenase-like hydrolase [Candidatus Peregrinibacteria bacterium]|nr:haloacid dehalogenase-like hydrolase [Candidatus Peregrinibacteria bacterium]
MIYYGENFESKLKQLNKDGLERLLVVADFDRTLTPSMYNGHNAANSSQVLSAAGIMPGGFRTGMDQLFAKYHPIELDHGLTIEEKSPLMVEWWMAVFGLMKEYGYSRQKLSEIIASGTLHWRDGVLDFLRKLHQARVPLLIFSAGMGDVIVEGLKAQGVEMELIDVIANFGNFAEDGSYLGTKEPIVHCLDKNESLLEVFGLKNKFAERFNVLLIGDSLHDLEMIEGGNHRQILKLGYLNHPSEAARLKYRQGFDLIVEGDGDFRPINDLLDRILGQ